MRTFEVAPEIFKQLYTLNVQNKGVNLPLFYALLPNKKESTYKAMFDMSSEHIYNPPKLFYCDFEKTQINSILQTWEDTTIGGCLFHFSRNLFKNLG